ncbi:MAG: HAD-IA family hydrolase [Gemmataceae bacterium]
MPTNPIQAVFFDLGGTLLHPVNVGRVYAETAARFGCTLDEETLAGRFRAAFRAQERLDAARGWVTSEARERERWQSIVRDTLGDIRDFDACFAELYDFYARPSGWTLDPEAPELLRVLHQRGVRLGVASNYDHRLYGLVRGIPELAPLSLFVVSADVGFRKPAAPFFAAMWHAAQAPAESILMVGDDLESDYQGARAAGMQAVLLDPRGRHVDGTMNRITSLNELRKLSSV